ncbi:dTMP kinase [Parvibium lacunae]|uniref:Thymidylate kinase n=1 Tax=Parvibium lacunae TaxID=1888893 RepID=A0A368L800_9BURK|nr:dTMP kinase [Parvibium lacunae]RCS59631.1 dTMP kinase [Parvibium lacunae]
MTAFFSALPLTSRFVSFEGIDGAGKTTHIYAAADFLRQQGAEVILTREPGGTPLGEKLRELLLQDAMTPETEALLMYAARQEHLKQVILPALTAGQWVLTDRFNDASFAYQGGGRGLATAQLTWLDAWIVAGHQPACTFLFDLPTSLAAERIERSDRAARDRFELEQSTFHERVRQAYRTRAQENPARFVTIDASADPTEVGATILGAIKAHWQKQTLAS